ncbi:hypothetical protein KVR01_012642 [Diaporthe batatas]|uniref:uncharacterized protein n=1 Tax=Diaporthe batatas TaxID=748121 RepID=UPI001D03812A|nr:uncharacterized protein KVR01_012642 [Diaporthe batatas]KAG8157600.1 hypothetical protein KVR01_012642 [Diaporthe batatas]
MFLHAGASLHGHEFSGNGHPPQSPTHAPLQRKRPYLRSAFPAPILRSTTAPPHASPWPLPQTPKATRPVSELYVKPVTHLLGDRAAARRSVPAAPVVRFKEPEAQALESPKPSMTEDEPSFYDSDASHTSSAPRPRRRRATPRPSCHYHFALPAPKHGSKKHLFKNIRPRLLFQLQELPTNQRPRPAIDVFPASLIAGPLVTARYINRCPRIFGAKGELGPHDLILLKSEDYDTGLSDSEEEDEHIGARREPLAIFSPVRGQGCDEIVMEDGTVWRATPGPKGSYNFVHTDSHGISQTLRWAKRNTSLQNQKNANRLSTSAATVASDVASITEPSDYKYTFSIINPQSRRHPILANLTPRSLELFEDFTTVSTSQGRFPPSRPMSYNFDPAGAKSPPPSPFSVDEPSAERQTQPVDEKTKQLIRVTGLWLALRITGAGPDPADVGEASAALPRERTISMSSCTPQTLKIPRRSTTGNISSTVPPVQSGLRRAVSTGAAFMQRRMMKQSHSQSTEVGGNMAMAPDKQAGVRETETDSGTGGCAPVQKQTRRVSWLKKLKH